MDPPPSLGRAPVSRASLPPLRLALQQSRGDQLLGEPLNVGTRRGLVDVVLGEDGGDRFVVALAARELVPDGRTDRVEGEIRAHAQVQSVGPAYFVYRLPTIEHDRSHILRLEATMSTTPGSRLRLSPSAVFRIVAPDTVEAVIDGKQHVLPMSLYRLALEFSSSRTLAEVRAPLETHFNGADLDTCADKLARYGILIVDEFDGGDASLQTILHGVTFGDAEVLPRIGREIENGRAVVIADAFDEAVAQRVHCALERCEDWRPYERHDPFFHFHHHNLYGGSSLPVEVRDCARVLGSTPTKLLLSVLTGADCRGPLSVGASMYLPGDYSLPHTDAADARSLAYIWYLTKDWSPKWGGLFVWCQTGAMVNPSFNSLIVFKVTDATLHFVAPVSRYACGRRLTVNGWWNAAKGPCNEPRGATPTWTIGLEPGCYGRSTRSLEGCNNVVLL
jgi:hypothetical protein